MNKIEELLTQITQDFRYTGLTPHAIEYVNDNNELKFSFSEKDSMKVELTNLETGIEKKVSLPYDSIPQFLTWLTEKRNTELKSGFPEHETYYDLIEQVISNEPLSQRFSPLSEYETNHGKSAFFRDNSSMSNLRISSHWQSSAASMGGTGISLTYFPEPDNEVVLNALIPRYTDKLSPWLMFHESVQDNVDKEYDKVIASLKECKIEEIEKIALLFDLNLMQTHEPEKKKFKM